MATSIEFVKRENSEGTTVANLHMPDGTIRRYKATGGTPVKRLAKILRQWECDKFDIEARIFLAKYEG